MTSVIPSLPSPLWQEFQHSQWPPRPPAAAVSMSRGCAGVPSKAETLLPSYQTTPRTLRSPPVGVRPAPALTRTARLPREQAVGRCMGGGRRTSSTAQRHLIILRGAGAQSNSWAVLAGRTGPFSTVVEDFLPLRFALVVIWPSRGGLGGWDRVHTGPCPLLYTYFRVSEPVLPSIQMVQTLRRGPGGSQPWSCSPRQGA